MPTQTLTAISTSHARCTEGVVEMQLRSTRLYRTSSHSTSYNHLFSQLIMAETRKRTVFITGYVFHQLADSNDSTTDCFVAHRQVELAMPSRLSSSTEVRYLARLPCRINMMDTRSHAMADAVADEQVC
jgi:hypothetical protein